MKSGVDEKIKPPFPWFGGKSRAAKLILSGLGPIENYVEPFAGSLAVLLNNPSPPKHETVNDIDHYITNFWRAVKSDPDKVAEYADWPVNEADLTARHYWLVTKGAVQLAAGIADLDYYDAKIAGWWVWGQCCWIGAGWCSGKGSWHATPDGWVKLHDAGPSVGRRLPYLGSELGVCRKPPSARKSNGDDKHLVEDVTQARRDFLVSYMRRLASRLRNVRVCCGDWKRILTQFPTYALGVTGIVLDPPYTETVQRDKSVYSHDSLTIAHEVREWAIANGDNPKLRIALCGYEGEHEMPPTWSVAQWVASGGVWFSGRDDTPRKANRFRERVWFSPHCPKPEQNQLEGLAV